MMEYLSIPNQVSYNLSLDIIIHRLFYAPRDRNNLTIQYLSNKIPKSFEQNYKRVSYCLNKKKTYNKKNLIPRYEGKLKIICCPHKNS